MRNDILFGILMTMLKEGRCTYNYLAEKFEISKRTVQRYMIILEMSGIPTTSTFGRYGGNEIMGTFNLNKMFFTKDELGRILNYLHSSPISNLDPIDKQIEQKLELNFKNTMNYSDQFVIDKNGWEQKFTQNPIIKTISKNLKKDICYKITYTSSSGEITERVISPYKFILKENKWYLLAYCHLKQEPRVFKVNRITEITATESDFVKLNFSNIEIDKMINDIFPKTEIVVEVNNSTLSDILEIIEEPQIIEQQNSKTLIKGLISKSSDLTSKLLAYYTRIKIKSPQYLIDDITNTCRTIYQNYANA